MANLELIEKIKSQILKSQTAIIDSHKKMSHTVEWYEEQLKGWKELADLWMAISDHYLTVIEKLQNKLDEKEKEKSH